jgi:hypothetical protein
MGSIEDHPNVPVTELPYTFLTIREEYSGSLKFIVMRQEPMTENEQALWDMKMEAFWQSWICHVSAMPH